jgi:hypothetical protein
VKSAEQQSVMVLHRVRLILMRQRPAMNAMRGHMAEFGLVAPIGREGLQSLIRGNVSRDERVPQQARACLQLLGTQLELINKQILETDRQIRANARATEIGRRLLDWSLGLPCGQNTKRRTARATTSPRIAVPSRKDMTWSRPTIRYGIAARYGERIICNSPAR